MAGLLVSVRSADEARTALAGGATVIDVKEPERGPLGRADPATWRAANPVERADLRPEVPVLLMHGENDEVLPVDFTMQFGDALEAAGHPTTVELVPDVDHLGIFAADVAAGPIVAWLRRL